MEGPKPVGARLQASAGAVGVALLGLGTVGSAVFDVLDGRDAHVAARSGGPVEVRRILVRDPKRSRPAHAVPLITHNPDDVFDDPAISIVVELVGCPGGNPQPALSFITRALESGKHVVTANKQVLAGHAGELARLAARRGAVMLYEGAVGGAIPIVRAVRDSLAADHISSITGILNGTTNYILTQMSVRRSGYLGALRQAQQLGYAEADPSSDVEGRDTAYKIALLAGLCFGRDVDPAGIPCEGITRITHADVAMAARLGYVVKLLATAHANGGRPELRVYPALLPLGHPLSRVEGPFNAVLVKSDLAGNLVFYGQGAGGVPTASAVVADIISAALSARNHQRPQLDSPGRPFEPKTSESSDDAHDEAPRPHFIHIRMPDHAGVTRRVKSILRQHGVRSRVWETVHAQAVAGKASAGVVTEPVAHSDIQACISRLEEIQFIRARAFRVEELPESTPR